MSKNILETLFESRARIRILRLLFRNVGGEFNYKTLAQRLQEDKLTVRRELKNLAELGLLKPKR